MKEEQVTRDLGIRPKFPSEPFDTEEELFAWIYGENKRMLGEAVATLTSETLNKQIERHQVTIAQQIVTIEALEAKLQLARAEIQLAQAELERFREELPNLVAWLIAREVPEFYSAHASESDDMAGGAV